ncbi:Rv3235 family protein [Cellulomonas sp. ATA003]|uniref:Rv3235 family protein n=1 Tax=Cellulomonas sp. ATA003 TaxID=3073064 RepID=UPI0028731097|nr:Rv3235 family protein [Cellulomonas sp. ATA003]WNB86377.1 Rv3235 family protein [Cellulomonas sp. ATA003]
MSAAAHAALPAHPGGPGTHAVGRGGPTDRLPLRLAVDNAVVGEDDPDGTDPPPADRTPGPRMRLAPRVEQPAERPMAEPVLPGAAPLLGSPEALARDGRWRRDREVAGAGTSPPGAVGTVAGPLPDPTPLCCAMVQAAVEGLRGARPLAQLVRWVTPEVYEHLALRAELVLHSGMPTTPGRAGIRRIRVCRIGDGAAEAAVVVDDGPRVRAVAVRLEAHRGRWRATALEIG